MYQNQAVVRLVSIFNWLAYELMVKDE
jgi:hypothetical protein